MTIPQLIRAVALVVIANHFLTGCADPRCKGGAPVIKRGPDIEAIPSFDSDVTSMSPGFEFEVSTAWRKKCRRTYHDGYCTTACDLVPTAAAVECSGAECETLTRNEEYRTYVTPTEPGDLSLRVHMTNQDNGREYMEDLGPFKVRIPDEFHVECILFDTDVVELLPCDRPGTNDMFLRLHPQARFQGEALLFKPTVTSPTPGVKIVEQGYYSPDFPDGANDYAATVQIYWWDDVTADEVEVHVSYMDWTEIIKIPLDL